MSDQHEVQQVATDSVSESPRLDRATSAAETDSANATLAESMSSAVRAEASGHEGSRRISGRRPGSGGRPRRGAAALAASRAKKTLGGVLRTRRYELRMTQREVADQLGVKPAHIAYLELDHRRPSLSLLNRIAQVLGLDRERLILLSHPEARSFFSTVRKPEAPQPIDQAWREFKGNKTMLSRHRVSRKELQVLSQVALLGRVTTPRSFLFILNSIRQAVDDEEP